MSAGRTETLDFPAWPQHGPEERDGLLRVLDQGAWWREAGSEVKTFEREFADHHGAAHGLATTNGTHALELALGVLGVGPGDEVIVPAFTFIATSLAVQRLGAVPVPVDVDPATYCLDAAQAERFITDRTKAIIPVHMAGQFCDMDALIELSATAGVAILQDAAHAHGAVWRGRRVGELGTLAAFSFQNGKLMTAGEGGLLLLPDEESSREAFMQHSCGRPPKDRVYQHLTQGSNYRLNEFSAAVLRGQLTRLDEQNRARAEGWRLLSKRLAAIDGVVPQGSDDRCEVNPRYMAMARIEGLSAQRRGELVDGLNEHGIPAFVAFPPVYRTAGYWHGPTAGTEKHIAARCPVSEQIAADCVWLHHRVLRADGGRLDRLAEIFADLLGKRA